jgi:prophage antirepressor-like protein
MNDMTTFEFEGQSVRVIRDEDGNPWWVAKDVCDVLDLENTSMALEKLDDDEKLTSKLLTSGQMREVWLVNEPGLYTLIIRSNKPEARKFKRWITHEVLPSIRRTGSYDVNGRNDLSRRAMLARLNRKGLRAGQRVRLLELAGRMVSTYRAELNAMFDMYELFCDGVADIDSGRTVDGSVVDFIKQSCVLGAGEMTTKSRLYEAYKQWAVAHNKRPLGRENFFRNLYAAVEGIRQYRPRDSDGVQRFYHVTGIGLSEQEYLN